MITKKVVKQILDEEQVEMWRNKIEPLEWLLKFPKPYAREQFDVLGAIFDVKCRKLPGLDGWPCNDD